MERKAVSGIMLTLLLLGSLTLAFNVQPVKASGTIYIRADGSIDPPTAPISTVDNVTYTFTDNINDFIEVERSSIIIDGAGWTCQGNGSGTGFMLAFVSNVTIKNLNISGFGCGIEIEQSHDNHIVGDYITNNSFCGILLDRWVYYTSVVGNNITNNDYGIIIDESSYNSVVGNNITNNDAGIWSVMYCNANSISQNNITNNSGYGISLNYDSDGTISGNRITNSKYGFILRGSSGNTLRDNVIASNIYNFGVFGDYFIHFLNDVDTSNTVDGKPVYYWINKTDESIPSGSGYVALVNCSRITAQNLTLTKNRQGILMVNTTDSTITNNNIINNENGIQLYWSSDNTVSANNITNNQKGITTDSSSNNRIYHNKFANPNQVVTSNSVNVWDDDYPSGGNYWSDYTGIDEKSGPNQDQFGSDGIGDTPYVIDANNRDRYPLMKPYPWGPHDIGITNIATSKTTVGQGYPLRINITVFNYGNDTENFNLTAYANTTTISTFENIILTSRTSTTLTLTWNTTGFAKGNYTISANATQLPYETDIADNTRIDGVVRVTKAGDFGTIAGGYYDFDDQCDYQDLFLFGKAYTKQYHPLCDFDNDLDVDYLDLFQFRQCYISDP